MPNPTPRDVHIERPLTEFSIAYRNQLYIGQQVFPAVGVQKQTDFYFVFDKQSWFRNIVAKRSPGTRAQRADYMVSTASYVAINYALAKGIPDEVRENADNPLRPDVEATEFVTDALLRAQEIRVANIVTASTAWNYAASPTTQWSSDVSDPLGDIEAAINNVIAVTGRQPNIAVMSWGTWRYLKNHPDLLDRIKFTRPGATAEPGDIAGWFGLDKVLIGTALVDNAAEGAAASMAYVWGSAFWTGYVASAPALMTPSAGYALEWQSRSVRRYREDQEHQDVLEASHYTAEVVTASDAGAVIYSAA